MGNAIRRLCDDATRFHFTFEGVLVEGMIYMSVVKAPDKSGVGAIRMIKSYEFEGQIHGGDMTNPFRIEPDGTTVSWCLVNSGGNGKLAEPYYEINRLSPNFDARGLKIVSFIMTVTNGNGADAPVQKIVKVNHSLTFVTEFVRLTSLEYQNLYPERTIVS